MSYEIKIPLFEGPFDLLLFFIERDEIDVSSLWSVRPDLKNKFL